MMISAAQCRAARALIDWSQDDLAKSACVARATIADFERSIRLDMMRQNMVAIVGTLEAAGIEFLPETDDGAGAGVRQRKIELEYSKEGRSLHGGILLPVRFRGVAYRLFITREVLDDLGHLRNAGDGERVRVAEDRLGLIVRAAELKFRSGGAGSEERVVLGHSDFPDGTF